MSFIRIRLRRDTAANWTTANPVLLEGEIAIETGNPPRWKVGDGVTAWGTLPYGFRGDTGPTGLTGASGNTWYGAAGAPATTLGVNGDWYFNTANGDVYEKVAGVWNIRTNLTGPAGPQGPPGPPVADGNKGDISVSASGSTWVVNAGAINTAKLGGDITTAGKAILDDATAADQRVTLGATTVGSSLFTAPNPGAIRFVRINADNTASLLDAPTQRTALGLGTAATAASTDFAAASHTQASSTITMDTARLLGRTTAGNGAVEQITVGTGLSLSAGALTATGGGGGGAQDFVLLALGAI